MILIDISSTIHRMIHNAVKYANPPKINGKYVTSKYSSMILDNIIQELFQYKMQYEREYGEIVICFDDFTKKYWRNDVFHDYKIGRKIARDDNPINYPEVFQEVNTLSEQLVNNTPFKCVTVKKAEADDTMMILSRAFCESEKILILSPDKDLVAMQQGTNNVKQYSALTKKYLKAEDKYDSMEHWRLEHICLGDASDGVPKVVDHVDFTESFLAHLEQNNVPEKFHSPIAWKLGYKSSESDHPEFLERSFKQYLFDTFGVYQKNKKGESTGFLDVYEKVRFGSSTLKKAVDKLGIDGFLDSHPLYRHHYERNDTLVSESGIPKYLKDDILKAYNTADTTYNKEEFVKYLESKGLYTLTYDLNKVFKTQDTLSIENCGW